MFEIVITATVFEILCRVGIFLLVSFGLWFLLGMKPMFIGQEEPTRNTRVLFWALEIITFAFCFGIVTLRYQA